MAEKQDVVFNNRLLNFLNKFPAKSFLLPALVLFIIFGWLWWRNIYSDPEHVFQAMLENSLRLRGVTRHVIQDGAGQNIDQYTRLSLADISQAESRTVLAQTGEVDATVETQSIGTPFKDFVRYTSIATTQKNANGEDLDFSTILNVWGSNDTAPDAGITNGELYNESVLGVVPMGNLSVHDRHRLLGYMRSNTVYEADYANVRREPIDGRPVYSYPVKVDAEKYVAMLKDFARMAGLNHLENVDPAAYAGSEKLDFNLGVDVWSRQLVRVSFGADEQRVETLSGHNAARAVGVPNETISVDELQARLQQLQQ